MFRFGDRQAQRVLMAVAMAVFCVQLDFFALNLAVPRIAQGFDVSASDLQWVISGYMLSAGAFMVASGRVGDLLGRRRVLISGLALFGLTSLICGLATSVGVIIGARVLQGLGAAMIVPVGMALLTNVFPADLRARAMGLTLGISGVATALGPFVGGLLTELVSWRWVFLLNVPIVAVAMALVVKVAESRDETAPRSIDIPGLMTVTAAIVALTAAVEGGRSWGWLSAGTLGLVAAAVLLLIAFTMIERRVRYPLIDLSLFRNWPYVTITLAATSANIANATYLFVATLYLQQVRGLTPLEAGLAFLAPSVATSLAGPIAGRLANRFPPIPLMATVTGIGSIALFILATVESVPLYVLTLLLCGGTFGLSWTLATIATQAVIRPERAGEASGVTLTAMVTAGGMGVALAGSSLDEAQPSAGQMSNLLIICSGIALVTAIALLVIARMRGSEQEENIEQDAQKENIERVKYYAH